MSNNYLPLKVKPGTIKNRVDYLKNIISGNIILKPGEIEVISKKCDIQKYIKNIGGEFKKIGSGGYGKIFKVCIDKLCDYEFVLKEIKYADEEEYLYIDNIYRPENVEVKIFRLLNDLILINSTPHIPLYLGDFKCKIKNDYYRYLMLEKADGDLFEFIGKNINNTQLDHILKVSIFQVIYTLAIIFERYPTFSHNDLKPHNVLYFNIKPQYKSSYNKYKFKNQIFNVPNTIRTAIWDFGFSSIVGKKVDNIAAEFYARDGWAMQTEPNKYKDIYRLLSGIIFFQSMSKNMNDTITFIHKYTKVSTSYMGKEEKRCLLVSNIEPYSLDEMLNDPYFDEFKSDVNDNLILNTYSDELVKNVNLNPFTSLDVPETKLYFKCNSNTYKSLLYYEYKNNIYNDKDRVSCYSSKNQPNIIKSYDNIKESTNIFLVNEINKLEMTDEVEINKIATMYNYLYEHYINHMYVPNKNINPLSLAIADKSIFNITKKHQIEITKYFNVIKVTMDLIIQFNLYLINYQLNNL